MTTERSSKSFKVPLEPGDKADLVVSQLVVQGDLKTGQPLIFFATVTNQGTAPSPSTSTRFDIIGIGVINNAETPALNPGQSAQVASSTWTAVLGPQTVMATADIFNVAPELDESNNFRTTDFTVVDPNPPPPLADLIVTDLIANGNLVEGQPVSFSATIKNQGLGAAIATVTRFQIDGVTFGDVSTLGLDAGASTTVQSLQWTAVVGDHTITAIADATNLVTETTETNNIRSIVITVAPGTPPPPLVEKLGFFYQDPAFKDPTKIKHPLQSPGNSNPNLQGGLWRQTWALWEPTRGGYDWSYYDEALGPNGAAITWDKWAQVEIFGGAPVNSTQPPDNKSAATPDWFYARPGALKLTFPRAAESLTVPWDPVLWAEITRNMTDFANRYKDNPKWRDIKIWQVGRASESFFVPGIQPYDPTDFNAANALAVASGYPDVQTAWVTGVKKLIDIFDSIFTPFGKKFYLVTGVPFQPEATAPVDPHDYLQQCHDYGFATYPGRFGSRNDDIYNNKPKPGDYSYELVVAHHHDCTAVGSQMGNNMLDDVTKLPSPTKLSNAFNISVNQMQVNYQQVFPSNCDDAGCQQVFIDYWNIMKNQTP